MDSVFLIGGSGFIGKNFVDMFEDKYDIYVFDKYIDVDFFRGRRVQTYQMDLIQEFIPSKIINPDYIINLSSVVDTSDDLKLFDSLISSNLKILLNLFYRFKDNKSLKLFIQFGSSEEYGNITSPFKEEIREVPTTPYALIKQLTVNTAIMLNHNFNFPAMAVRPGNLYGKYQGKNRFVPYIIRNLFHNAPLNVTKCEQKRDFMYCVDFVKIINDLMMNYGKCRGEIVNVSSGLSYTLRYLIETCSRIIGSKSQVNYGALPYKLNEIMNLNCSTMKCKEIVGDYVLTDIEKGLINCIDYYTARG